MTQDLKPFTPQDLKLHHKIIETCCAPTRNEAACVVRRVDEQQDSYISKIWLFPLDGEAGRALTQGPGDDTSPRWSPDGSQLAFLSTRQGGLAQIHVLADFGEPRQVTRFAKGVLSFCWLPDGSGFLATAAIEVDPDAQSGRAGSTKASAAKSRCQAQVAWRLPYKADGVGYILRREVHLFHVALTDGSTRQLTHGPIDVYGFTPSPDGSQVANVRNREGRFAHRTDLWRCDLSGQGHEQLTNDLASVMQPAWSPNGRWIAMAGASKEGDAQATFWLYDCERRRVVDLADEKAEPASGQPFYWRGDSTALVFVRAWRGRHQPATLGVPDGAITAHPAQDRQLGAFGGNEARLVYCVEHPSLPSELWSCAMDGGGERQLSHLNLWWGERTPVSAQLRSFEVPDGKGGTERIEGWLLRAAGAAGAGPLLNDVHGGPASYALMDYDTNVFWQSLCSQGWSVLALNAVGSSSYGGEFCARLAGHWGKMDLPQHLAAIRALRDEGVCDDRVAISGKSYGGYFSAFAIGQCSEFRAAIVMAPVGNIETHYGTSDGGYYADPLYMGSAPDFDRDLARELSPMRCIEKARTPTLFMQGADDERCPKCQSEELFVNFMRSSDTPGELVLYPGEDHHFLGEGAPSCREDAAQRIVDWLTLHVLDRAK